MHDDEGTSRPERLRLPGFDERAARGESGYDRDTEEYGARGGYAQRGHARKSGIRSSRRASSWTAAALIAAVAATTGYLAHSIPGTTTGATATGYGTASPAGKSTAVKHGAPAVSGPVVTSGGSGVAAASAAGGGRGGN